MLDGEAMALTRKAVELALATHGKGTAFDLDVEVVLFDARDFKFKDEFVVVLVDVDRRREAGSAQSIALSLSTAVVLEKGIEAVLE